MERYKGGSGKVLGTGSSSPLELGYASLMAWDMFTNPEALQTVYFRDFYGGFTMEGQLILNSYSSAFPLSENGW